MTNSQKDLLARVQASITKKTNTLKEINDKRTELNEQFSAIHADVVLLEEFLRALKGAEGDAPAKKKRAKKLRKAVPIVKEENLEVATDAAAAELQAEALALLDANAKTDADGEGQETKETKPAKAKKAAKAAKAATPGKRGRPRTKQ